MVTMANLFMVAVLATTLYSQVLGQNQQKMYGCTGNQIQLSCSDETVILIGSVYFGIKSDCGNRDDVSCLEVVDSEYSTSIKKECHGQRTCSFKAKRGKIYRSTCTSVTDQEIQSNLVQAEFFCKPESTLIDICSDTTMDTQNPYFVNPGFPQQVKLSGTNLDCTCQLTTENVASFYVSSIDFIKSDEEECQNEVEQQLTIAKTNPVYNYVCSDLTDIRAVKLVSTTKSMTVKFTSSVDTGRFWLHIQENKQQFKESIHVRCGKDIFSTTTNPTTTTSRTSPMATKGQLTSQASQTEGTTETYIITPSMALQTELSDGTIGIIIGGVVGIIVIIIAIVIIVICYRRRKKSTSEKKSVRFKSEGQKLTFCAENDDPENHTYAEVTSNMVNKNRQQKQVSVPMNRSANIGGDEYAYAYSQVPANKKDTNSNPAGSDSQCTYDYASVTRNTGSSQDKSDDTSRMEYAYAYGQTGKPPKSATDNADNVPTYAIVNKDAKKKKDSEMDDVEFTENTLYEVDQSSVVKNDDRIPEDVELIENDLYE